MIRDYSEEGGNGCRTPMSVTSSKNELSPYLINVPNKISITIKKSVNKMPENSQK